MEAALLERRYVRLALAAATGEVSGADERGEQEHGGDLERQQVRPAVFLGDEEDAYVRRRPLEALVGEREGLAREHSPSPVVRGRAGEGATVKERLLGDERPEARRHDRDRHELGL